MEEEKMHENPIPVVFEPTKVYNRYEIYNSPQWNYVYKVHFFLFFLGFMFGLFLGVYIIKV